MSRCAIYTRVSTADQAEAGTIEIQREKGLKFADFRGFDVTRVYADDGITGTRPVNDRPSGSDLLAAAHRKEFDVLVVYRLDRLGRSARVILNAVDEFERCDITVISATEPFDTSSPFGRFVLTILAAVAEFERENILERTQSGREKRARAGDWCGGPAPFGYRIDGDHLAAHPEQASIAKQMFEQMAYERATLLGICKRLNAQGVRTRYNGEFGHHSSTQWTATSIYNILTNPAYKGIYHYGRRGKSDVIEQPCPAIISEETWDAVQRQMVENKRFSRRNARIDYLLTGLIRCQCGQHYCGHVRTNRLGKEYCYYVCNRRHGSAAACDSPSIPSFPLDRAVWAQIQQFARNPGDAIERITIQQQGASGRIETLSAERECFLVSLQSKEGEKERILDLYRAKIIDISRVEREFVKIEAEAAIIREEIDRSEDRLRGIASMNEDLSRTQQVLTQLQAKIDTDVVEERRHICRSLIKAIVVYTADRKVPKGRPGHPVKPADIDIHWKFENPWRVCSEDYSEVIRAASSEHTVLLTTRIAA